MNALAPDLSIKSKHTVGKRIAANTGLMLGSKALGVLLGLGSIWIATKSLDVSALGYIFFLHAYMLFFSDVGTFQTWQAIIRFGTDDLKNERSDRLARLFSFGIRMDALAAILAYGLSLFVFAIIPLLLMGFPALAHPESGLDITELQGYAALYCILILFRQRGTSIGLFRLFDKFNVLAVQGLIMPAIRFLGAIIAALMGAGFEGFLIAWFFGSFCAYVFLPLYGYLELRRRNFIRPVFTAKVNFLNPRTGLWRFMIKSNIDSTLAAANSNLPVLLVMAVFGSAWVAVFRIAEEIAKLLSEGFKLLDQVIYPELAKLVANGEIDKIMRLVTRSALILLSFGTFISVLVFFVGPDILGRVFSQDYSEAAALTSLLVPAAALLGTAAPLYPVFYAANKPERAIYARGLGVFVYILTFFILSATIGKTAPGWAAILGNASSVAVVVCLALWTLKSRSPEGKSQENRSQESVAQTMDSQEKEIHSRGNTNLDAISSEVIKPITVHFLGMSTVKLWGLDLLEWQKRAFKKAGSICTRSANIDTAKADVFMDINWVLSSALAKAFIKHKNTALIVEGYVIATHSASFESAQKVIGQPLDLEMLSRIGLSPKTPDDLTGRYDKALRKTESPYALDTRHVATADIMKRQYASSYKGITDFITKFVWPKPAFYVTRACAVLKITPNMVTTLSLIMTLLAMYCFWVGQWWLGFATGWLMTFLDTVDGKLARTTMTYSSWGNVYDHGIDLIHPPFWYWAWFVGLGGQFAWYDPMSLALILVVIGYIVGRILEGVFLAQHGFYIHVWRPINSFMRFITARRNPNMFIFMIGMMLTVFYPQAGMWGFFAVAFWTWFCNLFDLFAICVATISRKPVTSWLDVDG